MTKCFIHPITYAIVAELNPGIELIIHDKKLLYELACNGITVSREFKKLNPGIWKVYPTDEKKIFAKAFEQFYSIYLQRQGYYWRDKGEYEAALAVPTEELVKRVLSLHKKSLEQNPPASKKRPLEEANGEIEPERKISSKSVDPDKESNIS